jgi:hypothetical protein
MNSLQIKNKVLQEIDLLPDDRLPDVYNFIHFFRLGIEKAEGAGAQSILAFAGTWQEMPDEMFEEFVVEVEERRRQAFTRRREHEGNAG